MKVHLIIQKYKVSTLESVLLKVLPLKTNLQSQGTYDIVGQASCGVDMIEVYNVQLFFHLGFQLVQNN